jgi:metallophosphoesterase superfamily enzyme
VFCIFRYLEKTFSRAVKYSQPHVIVFLGDLMDEGHIANGEDFEKYKRRLDSIFSMPDDIMVITLTSWSFCFNFVLIFKKI